jgi:hypothetical protein
MNPSRTFEWGQQEAAIAQAPRNVFGSQQTPIQAAKNVGLASSCSPSEAAVEGSVSEPLRDVEFLS